MIHVSINLDASYIQAQILSDSLQSRVSDPSQQALVTPSRHELTRSSELIEHGSQLIERIATDSQTREDDSGVNNSETYESHPGSFSQDKVPHPFDHLDHESESYSLPFSAAKETPTYDLARQKTSTEPPRVHAHLEMINEAGDIEINDDLLAAEQAGMNENADTRRGSEDDIVRSSESGDEEQDTWLEEEEDEEGADALEDTQMQFPTQPSAARTRTRSGSCNGQLDLVSSLVAAGDQQNDDARASLSQSQSVLPLFPESQRFKTPAHAGRKRSHDGKVIEPPPTESRNPFSKIAGSPTAAGGLSQFFANTQAVSSPALPVPTSALRSDNLSPGLELERRAQVSSPITQMQSVQRAWSEPQTDYVPMGESQPKLSGTGNGNQAEIASQDSFTTDIPSVRHGERYREARERERRARAAFGQLSSPVTATIKTVKIQRFQEHVLIPLPVNSSSRNVPSSPSDRVRDLPGVEMRDDAEEEDGGEEDEHSSQGELFTQEEGVGEQEAEQLQQNPRRSSRFAKSTTLIPATTKKGVEGIADLPPNTQPSPSMRQVRSRRPLRNHPSSPDAKVRIANSQRSHPATQNPLVDAPKKSSGDFVDRVPASPAVQLVETQPSDPEKLEDLTLFEQPDGNTQQSTGAIAVHMPPPLQGTPGEEIRSTPNSALKRNKESDQHDSTYDTAPSHVPQQYDEDVENSQPIRNGRRKRRRMEEISQDDFLPPSLVQISTSVDLADILPPDKDLEDVRALAATQDESPVRPKKRTRWTTETSTPRFESSETRTTTLTSNTDGGVPEHQPSRATQDDEMTHGEDDLPDIPSPKGHTTPAKRSARRSAYELGASPKPKYEVKTAQGRSQQIPSTLQHKSVQRTKGRPKGRANRPSSSMPPSAEPRQASSVTSDKAVSLSTPQETGESEPGPASTPMVPAGSVIAPQMLFAYFFGGKRAYYPARCVDKDDDLKYTIRWPGYIQPETMEQHKLCSLDLRVGDEVKVDMDGYPNTTYIIRELKIQSGSDHSIEDITDIYGHTHVFVEPKTALKISKPQPIPVSNLYILRNTFDRMLKRPLAFQAPVHVVDPVTSGISTPAVRAGTPTTPSSRSRKAMKAEVLDLPVSQDGLFANMAFCLSYTSDETSLQRITRLLLGNGGTILPHSFLDLLEEDLCPKTRYETVGFTALLTDRHSRKPKYMEALAFGLPCLSGRWVEACIKANSVVDWKDFLLPAGESAELDGAVRSRTELNPLLEQVPLKETLSRRHQPFADTTMIFVTGKGKTSDAHALHLSFIRIMGAQNTEKVADLAAGKVKLIELAKSDTPGTIWLMVPDKDRDAARTLARSLANPDDTVATEKGKRRSGSKAAHKDVPDAAAARKLEVKVADKEFVMQSLIMGRLASREAYEH